MFSSIGGLDVDLNTVSKTKAKDGEKGLRFCLGAEDNDLGETRMLG